ncbi:MAG: AAA family ATPase [Myxococcota bacterium]
MAHGLLQRDATLAMLRRHLQAGERLVTITGTAGVGKTAVARQLLQERPTAKMCTLSDARTVEDAERRLRRTLGLPPTTDLMTGLQQSEASVLILDNLEQLTHPEGIAALSRWLEIARMPFVVTSQIRLGLPTEMLLPLEPLDVDAAVRLFAQRYQALAGHPLSPPDAARPIVQMLDGLPLAIEMAAGQARLLGVRALHRRLSDALNLESPFRGVDPRHQTLQTAIAWSWSLLSTDQQRTLAWMSVFESGFSLQSAEEIFGNDALRIIGDLCDRSLLWVQTDRERPRYRLYVSVRDYAMRKLKERDEHDAALAAMAQALVMRSWDLEHTTIDEWLDEQPNLQRVVRHCIDTLDADIGLRALVIMTGSGAVDVNDEIAMFEHFLPTEDAPPALVSEAYHNLGTLYQMTGQMERAGAMLEQSMRDAPPDLQSLINARLITLYLNSGRPQLSWQRCEEMLGQLDQLPGMLPYQVPYWGAMVKSVLGDLDGARKLALLSKKTVNRSGVPQAIHLINGTLAHIDHREGKREEAIEDYQAILAVPPPFDWAPKWNRFAIELATVYVDLERWEEALKWYDHVLRQPSTRIHQLVHAARGALFVERGDLETARRIEWDVPTTGRFDLPLAIRLYRARFDLAEGRRDAARAVYLEAIEHPMRDSLFSWAPFQLLHRALQKAFQRDGLFIGADATWFSWQGGPRQDLSRRKAMRRLLATLLHAYQENPGQTLSVSDLFEAGWPGQRILESSARRRVQVAISSLRKMGLEEAVEFIDDGYRIVPDTDLAWETA